MSQKNESQRPAPGQVPGSEIADALAEVMEDQQTKATARETAGPPSARRAGPLRMGILALLALLSGYLWFGSPGWLDASADHSLSPELAGAGVRMEVYLQAVRVEDFLAREGRLPGSLAEAGDAFTEVRYERLDGRRYQLALNGPGGEATYLSSDSLELFLGDALEIIGGRR